jgi:hypothetical protein
MVSEQGEDLAALSHSGSKSDEIITDSEGEEDPMEVLKMKVSLAPLPPPSL